MSKEISDLMGRLHGDLIALQGMGDKVSPPPPPPPATVAQADAGPVAPPAKPSKEDYNYMKQLLDEIQMVCKDIQAVIDKEIPMPPAAGGASSSQDAGAGKEATSHKK